MRSAPARPSRPAAPPLLVPQAQFITHLAEFLLIGVHIALILARLLGHTLAIRLRIGKLLVHLLQPILDALMHLLHAAIALLNGALLLLVQPLIQPFSLLLHRAQLLLELLLLAPCFVCVEGLAAGRARHCAGLGPRLCHGLVARAVLVTLLCGCLGPQAFALLLASLLLLLLLGLARFTLALLACTARLALPLPGLTSTTSTTTLLG